MTPHPPPDELNQTFLLPGGSAEAVEATGFARLDGALSPNLIKAYEPEITRKVVELNTMHLPLEQRDTYNKAFLQVENLWQHSEMVRELVFSRRLARIAAELLGVSGVRLYHDQALFKEAGGGITPWHADQYYWPVDSDRTITVWIPLQDTPAELGPLEFAVGSHRFEFGRDLGISDDSESKLQTALDSQGFRINGRPYRLGDVSYHLGWTFHRAGQNLSAATRRVMTIIYIDADCRVAAPTNKQQRHDLATWMPGVEPGRLPDTPLNPILYRAN